ncbi:MAG: transcription antitermination factor NusB [Anaerovoracaceae bacterium]|nr:transcription antitermination factor NusB [Bacillota bacterium]MDD7734265.1 transcription antitermination factor NusB [Bacillota bacterium]MDY5906087.1 transcription antitermination factor NusB [Anaerovoracaceae bacterium]
MNRKEAVNARVAERENLMQMIYQMGITGDFSQEAYDRYINTEISLSKESKYSKELFAALSQHLVDIDKEIGEHSIKWKTDRMPAVDLAILRLALTEIHYMENIPVSVSINEAVNMAKKFSTEKSASFINGVLGKIVNA